MSSAATSPPPAPPTERLAGPPAQPPNPAPPRAQGAGFSILPPLEPAPAPDAEPWVSPLDLSLPVAGPGAADDDLWAPGDAPWVPSDASGGVPSLGWPDDDELWAADVTLPPLTGVPGALAGDGDEVPSGWPSAPVSGAPWASPSDPPDLEPLHPLVAAPGIPAADLTGTAASLWEPDPMLDAPLGAAPSAATPEPDEADAAALADAGFGGPLHTALGELRRISDDEVVAAPVPSLGTTPDDDDAHGDGRRRRAAIGAPAFAGGVGAWWSNRWRDVLPGMVVAALVVMAFAVVLATGGNHSSKSRVDTSASPTTVDPDSLAPTVGAASLPPDLTGAGAPTTDPGGVPVVPLGPTTTTKASGPRGSTASPPPRPSGSGPGSGSGATTTTSPPVVDNTTTTAPRTTTTTTVATTTTLPDTTTTTPSTLPALVCAAHPEIGPPRCP